MKPRVKSGGSKTRKNNGSVKPKKTKKKPTVPTSYKTGVMKKTQASKTLSVKSKTMQNIGVFNGKSTQETRATLNKVFEYPTEESDKDDNGLVRMEPKFTNGSEPSEADTKKKMSKKKTIKRTSDAKTLLIDMIHEIIKKKGEFRPEDLDPDQLKLFKETHILVKEMERIGIKPPRVNLLADTASEPDEKPQKYPGNNKDYEKYGRGDRYGVYAESSLDKINFALNIETVNFAELTEQYYASKKKKEEVLKVEEYEEDFTDEHLKYQEGLTIQKQDRKLLFTKAADPKNSDLPGIINSQKKVDEIKFMHVKRRSDAALMIQTWYRGYKDRKRFKKELHKKNIQDQEDYGYFEVTEQGVKQFLESRKRKIEDEKLKKQAIADLSQNEFEKDRFILHDLKREQDPFNMFNIFQNKLNGKDPFATPNRSMVTMPDTPTRSRSRSKNKRKQAIEKYNTDLKEDSISIRESIKDSGSFGTKQPKRTKTAKDTEDDYSEDFEDVSIHESIVGGSGDRRLDQFKSMSDIAESISVDKRKRPSSIRESINEDIMEESLARNGQRLNFYPNTDKRKHKGGLMASTESIREEISGSGAKFTPRIYDSIPEEIKGSDDYSNDFESGSLGKGKVENINKFKIKSSLTKPTYKGLSIIETNDDAILRKIEMKYNLEMPDKAEDLIFDLINTK